MGDYVHKDTTRIHEYVTSPSLDPSEAFRPDEHGVYPVNPLGFPETSYCEDSCEGDTDCTVECLGKANPAYPQANHFSVENEWAEIPPQEDIVVVGTNVANLSGDYVTFPIMDLFASTPGTANSYNITVAGDLSKAITLDMSSKVKVSLDNAGFEDYSETGLFATPTILANSVYNDVNTTVYLGYDSCKITGHVGEGRLLMKLEIVSSGDDGKYVLLTAQDNSSENGLYQIMDDGPWVRIASVERATDTGEPSCEDPYDNPSSLDNSTLCGHVRHGYSDREVADRVEEQVGGIIQNSRHPMSAPGDMSGAGSFTRWFVECGKVALGTTHRSGETVMVDGFGLGGYYLGECSYGDQCLATRKRNPDEEPAESPVTTFSIGTSKDAASEGGLPRDWPFTPASPYAEDENENNITLVKSDMTFRDSGDKVKSLAHDIYLTCEKCGGTGTVDGHTCPDCEGAGEIYGGRSVSNRIHVCVNSDFKPGSDGKTTFKKTYIHLPAPIDTKDGDEFEVTVSIPTVNTDKAFLEQATAADLSAYYEYVSQPRVVVMGGYWKFSPTMVEWTESKIHSERPDITGKIDIVGTVPFADRDGGAIPAQTKVRFTLDGINNCPRLSDITGVLETNETGHIVISDITGYPYGARMRGLHMKICGLAYLGDASDEPNNYTDTAMGLHSRNAVTLGYDSGTDEPGDLSHYNKFVTPFNNDTRAGRKCVNGDGDARQILASVYPTATNTFQWSVVGRNKMRTLDRLMTDEWDLGENSVSAMIWDSNKRVIDFTDTVSFFGYGDGDYGFTADTMPTRYAKKNFGEGKSVIGSQLRIKVPEFDYSEPEANPVQQARKAAAMFNDDFRKLRMFHGNKLPKISASSKIRVAPDEISDSLSDFFVTWDGVSPSDEVQANAISSAAWLSKARHLPEYVLTSGQDMAEAGNSIIGANPFIDDETREKYNAEFKLYGVSEYGSNDADECIPCSVEMVGKNDAFAFRSVISARVASDAEAVNDEYYRDANRVAELQKVSIDKWNSSMSYDFTKPYDYLLGASDYQKWMDIYSATANVFSIDTIPVPLDGAVPGDLSDDQAIFVSGDPMVTYLKESGDDIDFVSANLPFYDEDTPKSIALTKLLRNLVSPYSSKMPLRFWDGTRVAIALSNGDNSDIVTRTRFEWPESECDMPPVVRSNKVDDEFIGRSNGAASMDVNIHYAQMDDKLHMNLSAPPVKAQREWYNKPPFTGTDQFAGPSGYVRVFMKFKFSAQAGRWYTIDYMQTPMSYLTPLYGASAIETEINGVRIWTDSICIPEMTWKETLMHPYYKYSPMNINPSAIPAIVSNIPTGSAREIENTTDLRSSTLDTSRFERPYLSIPDGGLGLSAPSNVTGDPMTGEALADAIHANFWSVRRHLRPAVSVLEGTDIPAFDATGGAYARSGGTMGDSLLWGQFAFPKKGMTSYIIPSLEDND